MTRTGFASPRTARHYDVQLWLERRALQAALALAAPLPGDRVLDLGTGTGALLRRLAERPDHPREVTGIDASAAMLAQVPALPAGWTLREADARRLPVADGVLDVVISAYLIHLLEPADRRAVLAEIARVLTPGGRGRAREPARPPGMARPDAARPRPGRTGPDTRAGVGVAGP